MMFVGRNKYLKRYYRKLEGIVRFRLSKSTPINSNEVAHDFVMIKHADASKNEDDKQSVTTTMNYLREPLLDDID